MVAADALDRHTCYAFDGRFHFVVGSGWTIAVSSDSQDRIRVETCCRSVPKTAMWVLAGRHDRMAGLVTRTLNDVLELA